MASTPGFVVKRKRSTPASAPPPRKRPRKSDTPAASLVRQQTLTQAQWVSSAPTSFADDAELKPVEAMSRRSRTRQLPKGNSTLTQMPFFDRPVLHQEQTDLSLLALPDDGIGHPPPIPQGDAAYDSPRKPRKRKPSINIPADPEIKRNRSTQGSQEYRPSSRKSSNRTMKEEIQPRRTSRRIAQQATILSDPAKNMDFFEQALSPVPTKENVEQRQCRLEIQDSTATDEEAEYLPAQSPSSKDKELPSTPLKRSNVVRSSQTPETLSPSTRKIRRNAVELRSPLRERSVNIPTIQPATPTKDQKSMAAPRMPEHPDMATARLSKKRTPRPKAQVQDSQANVWSLPETSSPQKQLMSQPPASADEQEQTPALRRFLSVNESSERLEIPSTSQVVGMHATSAACESNESLPSLSELTGRPERPSTPNEQREVPVINQVSANMEIVVKDFAKPATPEHRPRHHIDSLEEQAAETVAPTSLDEVEESESDFGSPIANDTQFNFDVVHRTSSPATSQLRSSKSRESLHDTQRLSDALQQQADELPVTESLEQSRESAVLTPRLVPRSNAEAEQADMPTNSSSTEEFLLPSGPPKLLSTTQVTTTRVPLNDLGSEGQPTSSPELPSNKSITQRSVHPASMPHPSQISTQEATQAYYGQSSMILGEEIETPRGTEKITIKDSSSIRMTMSQIPAHRVSQAWINVDFGSDEPDTNDEYDLDPPSSDVQPPPNKLSEPKPPLHTDESSVHSTAATIPTMPPAQADLEPETDDEGTEPSPSRVHPTQLPTTADPASPTSSQHTPPLYSPLKEQHSPIPGFNNETQSNFTQHGHVTAAYIHRQRERGALPKWYTPKPYQVPGFTRR